MADGSHFTGYTRNETAELKAAFERVRERLPAVFRSFWHHAEIPPGAPALFRIHAEDGSPVLQLERIDTGRYRSVGLCRGRRIVFANCCFSIDDALRAAGLL